MTQLQSSNPVFADQLFDQKIHAQPAGGVATVQGVINKTGACAMLCAIAGYNTGAGNVCKAFDAGTSLTRAAPVINGMTPEQVYSRLRTNLPYEETRNYIVKVNERLPLYREWQ